MRTAAAHFLCLSLLTLTMAGWSAQPTFGPPKGERPRRDEPKEAPPDETAAPVMNDWRANDPERAEPSANATPGVWYAAKTAEGFRYAWSLPVGYQKGKGYNVVVIFHPDNQDFRWGVMNHRRLGSGAAPGATEDGEPIRGTPADGPSKDTAGVFRPGDIVVSVDGLGAHPKRPDLRRFVPDAASAVKCRDVLLELSRVLPVQRIYLYGYGGGGRFAQFMAGTFPAVTDGVLAQSAGLGDMEAAKSTVPIVLMHGAKDSVLPLRASLDARDAYEAIGHELVRVRVLRGFNDFVNPARASECIEWVEGMRTERAAEALAAAESMLTPLPKGADEYDYACPVWFAGAYEVLRRIVGEAEPKLMKPADEATAQRARAIMQRIDEQGAVMVKRARELMGPGDARALALDGGAWLGFLIALRDDFRGVPSVEAFFREIAWELVYSKHAAAAAELVSTWTSENATDVEKFENAMELLPHCFLSETLPVDLPARARVCFRKADDLGISSEALDRYEFVALWDQGCRGGLEEYRRVWSRWRLEGEK